MNGSHLCRVGQICGCCDNQTACTGIALKPYLCLRRKWRAMLSTACRSRQNRVWFSSLKTAVACRAGARRMMVPRYGLHCANGGGLGLGCTPGVFSGMRIDGPCCRVDFGIGRRLNVGVVDVCCETVACPGVQRSGMRVIIVHSATDITPNDTTTRRIAAMSDDAVSTRSAF